MSIYYIIFWSLVFFSFLEQFTNIRRGFKKYIVFLYSCLFVLMSTVYIGMLGDYHEYENFFYYVSLKDLRYVFNGWFEFLYTLVNLIVKIYVNNYVVLRFVLAVFVMSVWFEIYVSGMSSIIQNNSVFIMLIVWTLNFGNVFIARSTISIALCLYSMRYVEKKEFRNYFLCTAAAFGFHTMSICWIIVYPLFHKIKHQVIYLFSLLSMVFVMLFYDKIPGMLAIVARYSPPRIQRSLYVYINSGIENMFGMQYSMRFTILKGMANIFLMIALFRYLNFRYKKRADIEGVCFEKYFNVYLAGTAIYAVSMSVSIGLSRAAIPFTLTSAFLIPHIFNLPEMRRKIAFRFVVFVFLIMYLYLRFYLNIGNGTDDFNTIFQ